MNPPANARDMGLISDQGKGKIPHAEEQPSLCTRTPEPVVYSPGSKQQKPSQWEAQAPQPERGPHLPQVEKRPMQSKIND